MSWLRRLLRPSADQLELCLEQRPTTAEELLGRLRALGLRGITRCRLTRNRTVMVSVAGAELRVHRGYLAAGAGVHRAIVGFVMGRTRAERLRARRAILAHPVELSAPPARRAAAPEARLPADRARIERLAIMHARFNEAHFGGSLAAIRIRLSGRMRRRLGQYTAAAHGRPPEIAIARRHLRRDGWLEVAHTLLHEMVHQWQEETGCPPDHGPAFRAKAREVGIAPRASRRLDGALPAIRG